MKMQRGELVGFQGCLGYDYNPADKTITINEEEAAVVRTFFSDTRRVPVVRLLPKNLKT